VLHKEGSKAGAAAPDVVMQQAPEYDLGLDKGGAKVEGKEPQVDMHNGLTVADLEGLAEPEENVINTSANHQQRQYFPTSYEKRRTEYEQQVFDKY